MKLVCVFLSLLILVSCTSKSEVGTPNNPIKISLVPGQDTKLLVENGKELEAYFKEKTGLPFEVNVPSSFVAVIEALGSKRADVAIMNTFGYILAHEKYGAEAVLIGVFKGREHYWGQIITRKDGPKTLKDLQNKKMAFVDPSSGSGFVLPTKLLKDENIKLKDVIFAGRHDSVVTMVYQRQVDAGATYHTPALEGVPQDARKLVLTQFPDIFEKVQIIAKTDSIPNDPVVVRKDLPPEIRKKVIQAFKDMIKDEKGKKILYNLYHMDDFKETTGTEFEKVEKMLLELGKSAQDFIK